MTFEELVAEQSEIIANGIAKGYLDRDAIAATIENIKIQIRMGWTDDETRAALEAYETMILRTDR